MYVCDCVYVVATILGKSSKLATRVAFEDCYCWPWLW